MQIHLNNEELIMAVRQFVFDRAAKTLGANVAEDIVVGFKLEENDDEYIETPDCVCWAEPQGGSDVK